MWPFTSQEDKDREYYGRQVLEEIEMLGADKKTNTQDMAGVTLHSPVVAEESPHPPFANCNKCGGYFSPDKLTEAYTISIFSGTESTRYPMVDKESFCVNCVPEYEFRLSLMVGWLDKGVKKVEEDDYRDFVTKEGWFQEVDDEGNHLVAITPEQQPLIYFDCGCEIKKRGQTKCPSCEKPKK